MITLKTPFAEDDHAAIAAARKRDLRKGQVLGVGGLILFFVVVVGGSAWLGSDPWEPCTPLEPREFLGGYIRDVGALGGGPKYPVYNFRYRAKSTSRKGREVDCQYSVRVTEDEYSRMMYGKMDESNGQR